MQWKVEWDKVKAEEMAIHAPLMAMVLVSIPFGRGAYWRVQSFTTGVLGMMLLTFPDLVLRTQVNRELDTLHLFLLRFVGAAMLGDGLCSFLSRDSIDDRAVGGRLYSRTMSYLFLLITDGFCGYFMWGKKGMRINEKFLLITVGSHGLNFLASLVFTLRSRDIGGNFQPSGWMSKGLILDSSAMLIYAVLHFAFPSQLVKNVVKSQYSMDGVHILINRLVAAQCLGFALASAHAPSFSLLVDRKAHIFGRLLVLAYATAVVSDVCLLSYNIWRPEAVFLCRQTQTLVFGLDVYGHFHLDIFNMNHVTPFMLSGFYITFMLSLYFQLNKTTTISTDTGAPTNTSQRLYSKRNE